MSSHPEGPAVLADPAVTALLQRAACDPAEGLQVIALDRLVARPFDAGVALLVLVGMAFFLEGLQLALLPLGRGIAEQHAAQALAGAGVPGAPDWTDYRAGPH